MLDKKSNSGPFAAKGGNVNKENIGIVRTQDQEFNILSKKQFGWSRFHNEEQLNIKNANGVTLSDHNKLVTPGTKTINYGASNYVNDITLDTYPTTKNLYYIKVSCVDSAVAAPHDSITLLDPLKDQPVIYQPIESIGVKLVNGSGATLTFDIPDLPLIVLLDHHTDVAGTQQFIKINCIYVPIVSAATLTAGWFTPVYVHINERSTAPASVHTAVISPNASVITPLEFDVNPQYQHKYSHGAFKYFMRNYKTVHYPIVLPDAQYISILYNAKSLTPFVSENRDDGTGNYSGASAGSLILKIDTIYSGVAQIAAVDGYIVYGDRRHHYNIAMTKIRHYYFNYDNSLDDINLEDISDSIIDRSAGGGGSGGFQGGIALSGGNSLKGFGISVEIDFHDDHIVNTQIIPYVTDKDDIKKYAFNLNDDFPFTEDDTVIGTAPVQSQITDIRLTYLNVLSESRNEICFIAKFLFVDSSVTPVLSERTFIYNFKNTTSFSGGIYVENFDNEWRLYVRERRYDLLSLGNWSVLTSNYMPQSSAPVIIKELTSSIFSGNKYVFGYTALENFRYSIGQSITVADKNMTDDPFIVINDSMKSTFKGFAVPILFPVISPYVDEARDLPLGSASATWSAYILDGSEDVTFTDGTYVFGIPHTYLCFPTARLAEGNVWSSLPLTPFEVAGCDPFDGGYRFSTNPLTSNRGNYVEVKNHLYNASNYMLNGDVSTKVVYDKGNFWAVGNLIICTTQNSTEIYNNSVDLGFKKLSSIPYRTIAQPVLFSGQLVLPVQYGSSGYKLGIIMYSQEGTALLHVTDHIIKSKVVTHYLRNGMLAFSYLKTGSGGYDLFIPVTIIINNSLEIIETITEIEAICSTLVDARLLSTMKAYIYWHDATPDPDEVKFTEIGFDSSIYGNILSHKFFPPSSENRIFIARYLIINVDSYDPSSILYLKYAINSALPGAYTAIATENKIIVDLSPIPVKYFHYDIQLGSAASPGIQQLRNVLLIGHWINAEY